MTPILTQMAHGVRIGVPYRINHLPYRLDIEVPAIRGIAEHVTFRLCRVPRRRVVTSILDRVEFHPIYLLREGCAVATDSIEANFGCRHSRVAIIAKGVVVRHYFFRSQASFSATDVYCPSEPDSRL